MPKTTRKFPTKEKTTTVEGNREYRRLQQKEFRESKAAKDKAVDEIMLEFWNKSSGQQHTKKDYDDLLKKIDVQKAEDEKQLSSIINNTYIFKLIEIAFDALDGLTKVIHKDDSKLEMWKNSAEEIKERILDNQVKSFRYGVDLEKQEESEALNVIQQFHSILNNPDLTLAQCKEQIRNIGLSGKLISKLNDIKKKEEKKVNEQ